MKRFIPILFAGVVAMTSSVAAQGFSAADSGWVPIFNGVNFDGLYSRHYSQAIVRPPNPVWQIEHAGTDTATIYVNGTSCPSQCGHLGTDNRSYKHYRVRVSYRFDVVNANGNAGLTYHTDDSVPRMQNNWPRSIESQMKQNETGSAFSIQQLAFTTRTSSAGAGGSYNPNGNIVQACETGCNGRWYRGSPFLQPVADGQPRWMRKEVVVRGADSAIHIINDTVVFRLWNMRLVNNSGQTIGTHDSGALAIQSEGARIRYRRWEVMEFPASTPMSAHYRHRLFLDVPAAVTMFPQDPGSITFQWRSIGTIPWVRIERNMGNNGWTLVADSIPNTGSYTWNHQGSGTICASPACVMTHYRILGPDYVSGDSTVGRTTSLWPGGKGMEGAGRPYRSLTVRAGAVELDAMAPYDRAEIRDAGGRLVRVLPASTVSMQWALDGADGTAVRPGLYFIRARHDGQAALGARVLVP